MFKFIDNIEEPREKRPRWDQPKDVIKAVLDAREKFHEHSRGVSGQKKDNETYVVKEILRFVYFTNGDCIECSLIFSSKRDSISFRVPRWNFIAVTRTHDAQRIYVRVRNSEQTERKASAHVTSNLLSVPYSQLKAEAEQIVRNLSVCLSHPVLGCKTINWNYSKFQSFFSDSTKC